MELPIFGKNQRGFTLVELLVVIAIIAILMAIGTASYSRVQRSGRDSQRQADLQLIAAALEQYYGDYNAYPLTGQLNQLTLAPGGQVYLNELPQDPLHDTQYPYTGDGQTFCFVVALENVPPHQMTVTCQGAPVTADYIVSSRD